jgi:protein required for attachment to host cells
MNIVWILVCDSVHARLYETRTEEPKWKLVETLRHEGSRAKAHDLVTDDAGSRSSRGASVHHNALAPASLPKEVEKQHFAHTIGKTLDQAMRSGRFFRWVLVAPPHFVGLLKSELTSELEKHLLHTVDKDFTHYGADELLDRLQEAVKIPLDQRQVAHVSTMHAPR